MEFSRKIFQIVTPLVFLIGTAGCDLLPGSNQDSVGLQASGVVETINVVVAPEIAGRVAEVFVAEGDPVEPGDPLFSMEDSLIEAQRKQAVANLDAANANLASTLTALESAYATLQTAEANLEVATASARAELVPAQKALDDLYKNAGVARAEALSSLTTATRAVRDAQYTLDNFTIPVGQKGYSAFEAVEIMEERLNQAREDFEPYKYASSSDAVRKRLKDDLEEAQSDYDSAVRRLEYETALESAQAWLDKAKNDLEVLQDGPDPDDVATIEAQIEALEAAPKQAQALTEQARVGVTQAQAGLVGADKAVGQVQAALDLIDVQMEKLLVRAPVSGVVMVRNVQPGEVIQPGMTAMTIGQLDDLTVTVYIPEDRYGQISLGDQAEVTADSFPGVVFIARVTRIADRAEYTPRNVQTQEERRTTVFAIELSVDDPQGNLKPGMPVDVEFK